MAWRIYACRYIAESDTIDCNEVCFEIFCGDIRSCGSDGVTGHEDGSPRNREDWTGRKVPASYKATVLVVSWRLKKTGDEERYSFVGALDVGAAGVDAESEGAGDDAATGPRLRFLDG
jgi:hypothetical protein